MERLWNRVTVIEGQPGQFLFDVNLMLTIQNFLHEDKVEPAIKFPTNLFQMARLNKAERAMEPDRAGIVRLDPANHDMLAERPGGFDERHHQLLSNALAVVMAMHINRMLDGVEIAVMWPE